MDPKQQSSPINNIDEVEQLIQECNDINANESDISFDLGQFNDYLQNQRTTHLNQSQTNQSAKISIVSRLNDHKVDDSEEKDKMENFNQFDSIVQKSQFNFNESIFTHQISRQIGNFESSRIESQNNDFRNGLVNQNQIIDHNISDNYVEYIEKFLKNINIQEIQENEKSIEQALQLANQNLNLDYNQQSIMLNSLLYEINNINQFQESNENDIIIMENSQFKNQEDSQDIHNQTQTHNQTHNQTQTQNQNQNQTDNLPKNEHTNQSNLLNQNENLQQSKQESNQSKSQSQQINPTIPIEETKKIKQILKQRRGKDKLCLIFQMTQFLCIW